MSSHSGTKIWNSISKYFKSALIKNKNISDCVSFPTRFCAKKWILLSGATRFRPAVFKLWNVYSSIFIVWKKSTSKTLRNHWVHLNCAVSHLVLEKQNKQKTLIASLSCSCVCGRLWEIWSRHLSKRRRRSCFFPSVSLLNLHVMWVFTVSRRRRRSGRSNRHRTHTLTRTEWEKVEGGRRGERKTATVEYTLRQGSGKESN